MYGEFKLIDAASKLVTMLITFKIKLTKEKYQSQSHRIITNYL
jgi:hypothetical protein